MNGRMSTSRTARPIFIVGFSRSGTTLTRLILDAHPRLSCGPQTGLLADVARVMTTDWQRYASYGLTRSQWYELFADMFDRFQTDYAVRRGKARWADKTPGNTLVLPFVEACFPDAQYVHVVRDPRDVVASHRRKWGRVSAAKATHLWPRYVAAARGFQRTIAAERWSELRYEVLVQDPEPTLRGLMRFLGEPWDDALLCHLDAPHDIAPTHAELVAARRRELGETGQIFRGRVGGHVGELEPLLHALLATRTRRQMRRFGYGDRAAAASRPSASGGDRAVA